MVSVVPSGLPTLRGPGGPTDGIDATVSTEDEESKFAAIRCTFDAPKLRM